MIYLSGILTSIGKVKVLEQIYMAEKQELLITELATLCNMNYTRTKQHVSDLDGWKILEITRLGRIQLIRFANTTLAMKMKAMLTKWYGFNGLMKNER